MKATTEINKMIENLNKEQKSTFDSLVKLGDSKELALNTVLNLENNSTEMYQMAYYS